MALTVTGGRRQEVRTRGAAKRKKLPLIDTTVLALAEFVFRSRPSAGATDRTLSASDTENGWVVEADTGDAMHDGQYCEWEAGTPVGFAVGDTVGLLLQLAASPHSRALATVGRLTLYKNGQRRGVPFDGLHSDAGFSWAVELSECGDKVSILARPPPLGPDGSPLQRYTFESCANGASGGWRATSSSANPPAGTAAAVAASSPRDKGRSVLQQMHAAPFEAAAEQAVEALRGRQPHAEHYLVRQTRPA